MSSVKDKANGESNPLKGIVIFSGGTASNGIVDVFTKLQKSQDCPLSYVIPISDNGGSSSEIIHIIGGPGIGDLRSKLRWTCAVLPSPYPVVENFIRLTVSISGRLIRLIPESPPGSETSAVKGLVNYRLPSTSSISAYYEWLSVVDGTSRLWEGVSLAKKELIRSFLNLVNMEILKRARPPTTAFDFSSASVGNLFLTGARIFSGSLESAIYLMGIMCMLVQFAPLIKRVQTDSIRNFQVLCR